MASEVKGHLKTKVAYLIKEVDRKSFIQISKMALELYAFEIQILVSEVKFDLRGQRSSQHKIADLISTKLTEKE